MYFENLQSIYEDLGSTSFINLLHITDDKLQNFIMFLWNKNVRVSLSFEMSVGILSLNLIHVQYVHVPQLFLGFVGSISRTKCHSTLSESLKLTCQLWLIHRNKICMFTAGCYLIWSPPRS
jgi:hypothetical protein